MKKLTSKQAAAYLNVCVQRIHAKIKQGHFAGAHYCECGKTLLIPKDDVVNDKRKRKPHVKKSTNSNVKLPPVRKPISVKRVLRFKNSLPIRR